MQSVRSKQLDIERFQSGAALLEAAGPFLMGAEAENNVILSMANAPSPQMENALSEGRAVLLAVLNQAGKVECVASNHQDAGLFVSESTYDSAIALCDYLARSEQLLKKVLLPSSVAVEWVNTWKARCPCSPHLYMTTRLYRCSQVAWPRLSSGVVRIADQEDADQIACWKQGFLRDAWAMDEPLDKIVPGVMRAIEQRRIFLWVDQQPVSYLHAGGHTPHGARVIQVFTPAEYRGRGYASNLTARVTQQFLKYGKQFCVLEADLANPTSNHIYQALGYQPRCDRQEWHFTYES